MYKKLRWEGHVPNIEFGEARANIEPIRPGQILSIMGNNEGNKCPNIWVIMRGRGNAPP